MRVYLSLTLFILAATGAVTLNPAALVAAVPATVLLERALMRADYP
jgi:hypothetical protein